MEDILKLYEEQDIKVHVIGGEVFRGKLIQYDNASVTLNTKKRLSNGQAEVQLKEIIRNKITCITTTQVVETEKDEE